MNREEIKAEITKIVKSQYFALGKRNPDKVAEDILQFLDDIGPDYDWSEWEIFEKLRKIHPKIFSEIGLENEQY